jgi:hypothetical protein
VSGAPTLSGGGTLTVSGVGVPSTVLSGAGVLTVGGKPAAAGVVALTVAGALTLGAVAAAGGGVPLAGAGVLVVVGAAFTSGERWWMVKRRQSGSTTRPNQGVTKPRV